MTKLGFASSEGCRVMRSDIDPAMRALDLGPEEQGRHHQHQRRDEDEEDRHGVQGAA
jgi:hypothetical protein